MQHPDQSQRLRSHPKTMLILESIHMYTSVCDSLSGATCSSTHFNFLWGTAERGAEEQHLVTVRCARTENLTDGLYQTENPQSRFAILKKTALRWWSRFATLKNSDTNWWSEQSICCTVKTSMPEHLQEATKLWILQTTESTLALLMGKPTTPHVHK